MSIINLPAILQTISPNSMPGNTPFGPGGTQLLPPPQWQSTFNSNNSAVDLPPANLDSFLNSQDINEERNAAIQEANELSKSININDEVNSIIDRNKSTLGLNGGPNGFYDISLVTPASGAKTFDAGNLSGPGFDHEPDGFRLYLIAPPSPAKAVQGAASVVGGLSSGLGDAANSIFGENQATELLQSIDKGLQEQAQQWTDSYNQYVTNAYDKHAEGNTFYSVILPVPNELIDSYSHRTDDIMLGILPRLLSGIAAATGGGGTGDSRTRRATGTSGSAVGQAIGGALGGLAAEAGAFAFDNARARLGVGLNPNVETIYVAPDTRKFQFTFTLYPKSEDEVKKIRDFIKKVKQHSHPLSVLGIGGQNQLFLYPGEVWFEFSGRFRGKLFRSLRPCIITGLSVSYKNSEGYQHFEDGGTIVYVITITLTENRFLDRNILVDDEEKYQYSTFADEQFRRELGFRDTFMGEGFQQLATDPQQWFNDNIRQYIPWLDQPNTPNNIQN